MFFGEVVVFWHQYLNLRLVDLRPFETMIPFGTIKNINLRYPHFCGWSLSA